MKKVILISACSFSRPGPRVGMQFIAQILARNGFEVHYVSQPSSPVDCLSSSRRERFRRAWTGRNRFVEIEPNLVEHFVRAPYPVNKKFWVFPGQYHQYGRLLPRALTGIRFDLCIHDVSSCFPLVEHLSFRKLILRLNDHPEGFSYVVPRMIIKQLLRHIASGRYQQIWPVSSPLLEYTRELDPDGTHVLLSNGVDVQRFLEPGKDNHQAKTAVFVGALDKWVDFPLLDQAARLLPDWRFDLYGPQMTPVQISSANIAVLGPMDYRNLPQLLRGYQIGLIPFRSNERLIAMMERPLKFYEYLAAGLGIAATAAGGLQRGMQGWARFGSTPPQFANAIHEAAGDLNKNVPARKAFLETFSWERIGELVLTNVEKCLAA